MTDGQDKQDCFIELIAQKPKEVHSTQEPIEIQREDVQEKKPDPIYLLYAVGACLSFATGGILRKYQGENVFLSTAMTSIAFLITAIVYFVYAFYKKRNENQQFVFPWQLSIGDNGYGEQLFRTDKTLLILIIFGGALELLGAEGLTIGFKYAFKSGLNGGIVGAILSFNTVFIIIATYFLFKETLNKVKFTAIAILVTAVVSVTLFPPGTTQIIKTQDDDNYDQLLMVLASLFSSLCFGTQLITFKFIVRKQNTNIFGIGFGFLLFCGGIGLISFIFHVLVNSDLLGQITLGEVFYPMLIGFFTALGIVFTNIAGGIGVAGISMSIVHCQLVLVTIFNYFIFSQNVSVMQMIGVLLAVFGGIILAFEEKFKQLITKKQINSSKQ